MINERTEKELMLERVRKHSVASTIAADVLGNACVDNIDFTGEIHASTEIISTMINLSYTIADMFVEETQRRYNEIKKGGEA